MNRLLLYLAEVITEKETIPHFTLNTTSGMTLFSQRCSLLNIINKNKMSSDNGHTIHVNGLPEGGMEMNCR